MSISVILGLFAGVAITCFVLYIQKRHAKDVAKELITQTQAEKIEDLDKIITQLKESFKGPQLRLLLKAQQNSLSSQKLP